MIDVENPFRPDYHCIRGIEDVGCMAGVERLPRVLEGTPEGLLATLTRPLYAGWVREDEMPAFTRRPLEHAMAAARRIVGGSSLRHFGADAAPWPLGATGRHPCACPTAIISNWGGPLMGAAKHLMAFPLVVYREGEPGEPPAVVENLTAVVLGVGHDGTRAYVHTVAADHWDVVRALAAVVADDE